MNGRHAMLASVLMLVVGTPLIAQEHESNRKPLTVERIFQQHEFGEEGASIRWLEDSSGYLTWEGSRETPGGQDLVQHDPATGKSRVIVPAAQLIPAGKHSPLAVHGYELSKDRARLLIFTNSQRVWRRNTRGDYWVLDRSTRELRKLGGDAPAASLMFAKLSPDGLRVAYVRNNNLYVEDLRGDKITPLTDSKSPDEINGTFDWVYEEEFNLRDGYRWSPNSQHIAFWQLDTSGIREYPLVNNTDSLYPRVTPVKYPKVGEKNAACRICVAEVNGGKTDWWQLNGDPRENYVAYVEWLTSDRVLLQQFNRRQNTVRVHWGWLNPGAGSTLLLEEHDDAWLDLQDELPWIEKDGEKKTFLWLSERGGWRHIYEVGIENGKPRLLTPGDYDVIGIAGLDNKAGQVYFTASPDNPTQKYLYRVGLNGETRVRVTPENQPGTHDYELSPDARWALHHYSTANTPPVVELIKLPSHERVKLFTDNAELRKKLDVLEPVKTEFFRVDIGDGVKLDGWCMLPPHLDPQKKYPLLIHVYGEPAGQTVVDRWGGGNGLWHRMLAEQGYVVMSFDNRGTPAPRGRAWRKSVFHKIGILSPKDQAAALRAVLKERPYLDPKRVGIWGWSGGGSSTLQAMFKYPDLYTTGISIAPVAVQRLYDTIYQERYMGLPGDNVDGYIQGSAINFAHQLKGNLLIIHGTGDDNCHYQGTEMLINELIRHDKPF
ncbi:MAG: S9 family peptidase, partial [Isosphaeraceae bacterium]